MKRVVILIVLFSALITGCSQKPTQKEDFSGLYFINFPDVMNIIYVVGQSKGDVTVLTDNETHLVFGFTERESYYSYARILEASGYTCVQYDATVSGTMVLENDKYLIRITCALDASILKENFADVSNIDKITDENTLFELTKK